MYRKTCSPHSVVSSKLCFFKLRSSKLYSILLSTSWLFFLYSGVSYGKDYYVELDVGGGYNSNVFLESDETISIGEVSESESENAEERGDLQSIMGFSAGYEFMDLSHGDGKILFDFVNEKLADNDIDISTSAISSPYTLYVDNFKLRVMPRMLVYTVGGVEVLQYRGVSFDLTRKTAGYKMGIGYQVTDKSAEDVNYLAYDGVVQDLNFHFSPREFSRRYTLVLGLSNNEYGETIEGDESHTALYLSGAYQFRHKKYTGKLYAKIKNTHYVSDPFNGFERQDTNLRMYYKQSYYLSKTTTVFLLSEYMNNQSNQIEEEEDKNYSQWINMAGARWQF